MFTADEKINNLFQKIGIIPPRILLPADNIDMRKWSVVACDQYTSQPEYWDEVEKLVGDNPSTLRLILPEVYLESSDVEQRINKINATMKEYMDKGILVNQEPCFIYLERETPRVKCRKGLIMAVDLEKYDYSEGSQALIRATEKTIIERLPPRVKIRKNALIEVPHIQLLIDDPEMTVFSILEEYAHKMEKIYDFDLLMGGGHVKGYKIDDENLIINIAKALEKLADPDGFPEKYKVSKDKAVLLFAVGDGNHSLAAAKVHWENVKSTLSKDEAMYHPARYAMVEVVNVHDEGLIFEPIHRVLFNVNPEHLLDSMAEYFGTYSEYSLRLYDSKAQMETEVNCFASGSHVLPFVHSGKYGIAVVNKPRHNLVVSTLQEFLDWYIAKNPGTKIDFIHGDNAVTTISNKPGNFGFYLPAIDKYQLFRTIILDGTLPRKTFSMGDAEEKRYYLECRKITG